MPDTFDSDLNAYLRGEDAKADRCEEIADDLTALFVAKGITQKAELYMNGKGKGEFTLQEAIAYACEHDDDDIWTIEEFEE